MARTIRAGALGTLALAALALDAEPAAAQHLSWSSAAEAAGDEVYLIFTEPTLAFGPERGLQPLVSVGAHMVFTDGEDSWGVTPAAGLRYMGEGGFIAGKAGWAFVDDDSGVDVFGGDESGLWTSLHTEFWGDGVWGLQGIASYNWGADFLWSRARLTRALTSTAGGSSVALGAELAWAVETDDDLFDDDEYEATYIGPVLQMVRPGGNVWALAGGVKMVDPGDDSTWYARVEFTIP